MGSEDRVGSRARGATILGSERVGSQADDRRNLPGVEVRLYEMVEIRCQKIQLSPWRGVQEDPGLGRRSSDLNIAMRSS